MAKSLMKTKLFLSIAQKAKHGSLFLTTPDGEVHQLGVGNPRVSVTVTEWSVFDEVFTKGDIGLAESIFDKKILTDNPAGLIQWACQNDRALHASIYGTFKGLILDKLRHLLNRNSRKQASRNIKKHYDLGNDFYELWLDQSMTYSAALFKDSTTDLKSAQIAKYDEIIDSLSIKSGDTVLEIGCGWGGFFSRAVERTDCKVKAITLSPSQLQYSKRKLKDLGMQKNVDMELVDYRLVDGTYDKIVSIEMIEAVGSSYLDQYFQKIRSSMKGSSQALIQAITIRDDLFFKYKSGTDFIQKYVFPGGMLPSPSIMKTQTGMNGLSLERKLLFGEDYAKTLEIWQKNFREAQNQVVNLGYDSRFIDIWDFYYSYCIGAFRAGRIDVGQYQYSRGAQ